MPKLKHEPTTREIIALNIKMQLMLRGMKPKDMAKRLNVSVGCVGKWLRGENAMSVDTLGMVAEILKTTPDKLLIPAESFAENCTRLIC